MKPLYLTIIVTILVIALSSFILTDANALSPFLQTDKKFYVKGDIILVYGSVGNYIPNTNAAIQVLDNKNNPLLNYTTIPKDDGTFLVRIPTNDTNWKTGGPYKISVQYGICCHVGDSMFTFYAGLLPPLKQTQLGTVFWNITCDSGLVKIMKQEDGSVACVNPNSVPKLVSRNWGYDPSEKLTVYGLKDTYRVGQEIDFKFRVNGFGTGCEQPSVIVRNFEQQIVWQSVQYASGCGINEPSHMESEAYLGNETHLGDDYNGYGVLTIKQSGTYFMNISWLDGNVTKEFTVIENQITSTKTNDPFGITALIIYHPPDVCLNLIPPSNNVTVHSCPPNKFYLKINSNSTAYLMGYNICDGNSCAVNNTMSLALILRTGLNPDYQMIGLPVNLPWKYGDTVEIQLSVSPTNDNKTASLVDLGDSKIVP